VLLRPSGAKSAHRLGDEKDVIQALMGALPGFAIFSQQFHPAFTNGLPLHWSGFQDATCYTYVIDDLSDPERVWAGLRENIRREVRKAERQGIAVREDLPFDRFLEVQRLTFERQGMPLPFTEAWGERFERAMAGRGRRMILGAVDGADRLHAAAYLVWDARGCHYVMGGGDPDLRTSGAHSLLLWRALNAAAGVAPSFDFGGSMIEGVERFFRAFGGEQRRFFRITKVASPWVKVRHHLMQLMSDLRRAL
jgi:CelD/BcsL family acetyltransferase involved in cellulose biosynthesis